MFLPRPFAPIGPGGSGRSYDRLRLEGPPAQDVGSLSILRRRARDRKASNLALAETPPAHKGVPTDIPGSAISAAVTSGTPHSEENDRAAEMVDFRREDSRRRLLAS